MPPYKNTDRGRHHACHSLEYSKGSQYQPLCLGREPYASQTYERGALAYGNYQRPLKHQFDSRDEIIRKTKKISVQHVQSEVGDIKHLLEICRWEKGLEPVRKDLLERVQHAKYKSEALDREVQRARLQVQYDKALSELYPTELKGEVGHVLNHSRGVLQDVLREQQATCAELEHVVEADRITAPAASKFDDEKKQVETVRKHRQWKAELNREKHFHAVFHFDWRPV
ncbi:hypothetical protein CYMTET_30356 [Cymbomonas tetramitiformis]|uniref:Uncharacterized protein n=1 Tax=Cymbomonas tetramitiformis TaxID=36881 RepID=A0AAE0KU09_9CHLO|nr:hypothetical protein CYMTET_30356 [Cymbomonas tetramitiformis]